MLLSFLLAGKTILIVIFKISLKSLARYFKILFFFFYYYLSLINSGLRRFISMTIRIPEKIFSG